MIEIECKLCKKIIEGYTSKHIKTLLLQHLIKHFNENDISDKDLFNMFLEIRNLTEEDLKWQKNLI